MKSPRGQGYEFSASERHVSSAVSIILPGRPILGWPSLSSNTADLTLAKRENECIVAEEETRARIERRQKFGSVYHYYGRNFAP